MKKNPSTKHPVPNKERFASKGKSSGNVSLAEIARTAGVSPGLVSAFFSGKHYRRDNKSGIGISEATRKKIKETCRRINYVPENPVGFFRLYPEKADIGFMLSDIILEGFASPNHSLMLEGVAEHAFESGVDLSNLFFREGHDYLIDSGPLPNSIQRGSVRKIILAGGATNYALIHCLLKMEAAIVTVGAQVPPVDGIISIVPDYYQAAYKAIRLLHEHGHRDIVVIAEVFTGKDRYHGKMLRSGCVDAMKEIGLTFDEQDILVRGPYAEEVNSPTIDKILARTPRPTAIYCFTDRTARGLALELAKAGVRVPDEISILTGEDDRINQSMQPGFSAFHLPFRQIGKRAYDELTRIAIGGPPPEHQIITLPVEYVDRGTIRTQA